VFVGVIDGVGVFVGVIEGLGLGDGGGGGINNNWGANPP
jgi:hypothetical protein